jgi:hypothetical protein
MDSVGACSKVSVVALSPEVEQEVELRARLSWWKKKKEYVGTGVQGCRGEIMAHEPLIRFSLCLQRHSHSITLHMRSISDQGIATIEYNERVGLNLYALGGWPLLAYCPVRVPVRTSASLALPTSPEVATLKVQRCELVRMRVYTSSNYLNLVDFLPYFFGPSIMSQFSPSISFLTGENLQSGSDRRFHISG